MAVQLVNEDLPLPLNQPLSCTSDSCTVSSNDEVELLQAPVSLKEFDIKEDTKASNFVESTLPACVFRAHLKVAKNEDMVLATLGNISLPTKSPTPTEQCDVYENVDNGSKTNFLLKAEYKSEPLFDKASTELSEMFLTNAITFDDVISQPMLSHAGKVLMCANASLPVMSYVNEVYLLNTVIEDISSKKVARLEVVCDLHEADLLALSLKHPHLNRMEPDSILLIHDPSFQIDSSGETLSICAKKIRDIAFLGHVDPITTKSESRDQTENSNESTSNSNCTTTHAEDKEEESSEGKSKASLWVPSSTCEEKYARDEWKEWGNEYSVRRMHSQALVAYTIAQRFDPNSVELAAARIASLINLGMFSAALKDVDSVIHRDPFNEGLITRKAHCLWGLGKYDESVDYLKACLERLLQMENLDDELMRKSMFIQKIISKNEKIIQQSESPELWNSEAFFINRTNVSHNEPEYYAPISLVCKSLDGDGRNSSKTVVTNKPVPAGMLLVKTKAFSVVFQEGGETGHGSKDDELVNVTMQKLVIEKPGEVNLVSFKESTKSSSTSIELSKTTVKNFCEKFYYASDDGHEKSLMKGGTEFGRLSPTHATIRGLWTFPANVRHACVGGNAIWYICGNIMFIRAICNIDAGEEVIMAHVDPTKSYEFRTQFLKQKGIECSCSLCQFEKNEPEQIKGKRRELLREARTIGLGLYQCSNEYSYHEVKRLKNRLEDLELLRSAYAKLNFPIVEPLYDFGLYLMKIENFDEAINAFEKAFYVIDNTAVIFTLINLSFLLSYCYMAKKKNSDQKRAKKWYSAMKSYAKLSYGCLEPVKASFKAEFQYLKRKGIAL